MGKRISLTENGTMKICSSCKLNLQISHYHKVKTKSTGLASSCRLCCRTKQIKNKDKLKTYNQKYRKNNAIKLSNKSKENYRINKAHKKVVGKKYRDENKEKIKRGKKKYYDKNKEKLYVYNKERLKLNSTKLKDKLSAKIRLEIPSNKLRKLVTRSPVPLK